MRVQIASLVLAEHVYRPFKVHLHDDVHDRLVSGGGDLREYLRDRIRRQLRTAYASNDVPLFFFVMEDRDGSGGFTRPHAHGSIEIRPLRLELVVDQKVLRHLRRIEVKHGTQTAESEAGRWAVRQALKAAAGLKGYQPKVAQSGLHQSRNVWTGKPRFAIFNKDWVTYVFKNADEHSPVLGENRLAFPYDLRQEAKVLWSKIRG